MLVPRNRTLADLHRLIQIAMNWTDIYRHRFYIEGFIENFAEGSGRTDCKILDDKIKIQEIGDLGINELQYEYGSKWNIKVIMLSPYQPEKSELIRCVAGEGAAPPEKIGGPLRFRKILYAIDWGSNMEKQAALQELGPDFVPDLFDMEKCNMKIKTAYPADV
jgi:hypothetical protein